MIFTPESLFGRATLGLKSKFVLKIFGDSFGAAKFLRHMLSLILRMDFFRLGKKLFFFVKLLRPFVGVNSDF